MPKLTINNTPVEVEEGTKLLQAIEKVGGKVPTLCHHKALTSYGACRLCIVEVHAPGLLPLPECLGFFQPQSLLELPVAAEAASGFPDGGFLGESQFHFSEGVFPLLGQETGHLGPRNLRRLFF